MVIDTWSIETYDLETRQKSGSFVVIQFHIVFSMSRNDEKLRHLLSDEGPMLETL